MGLIHNSIPNPSNFDGKDVQVERKRHGSRRKKTDQDGRHGGKDGGDGIRRNENDTSPADIDVDIIWTESFRSRTKQLLYL